jgi:hypothetical protein
VKVAHTTHVNGTLGLVHQQAGRPYAVVSLELVNPYPAHPGFRRGWRR